jgi:hypothetical protein
MTTSGTNSFNLNLTDIIEEAYERIGTELRGGYELRTARRSLDLLMREWANRGINFWTIEEQSVAVGAGINTVSLGETTIDVFDVVWRTGSGQDQFDRTLNRMSVHEWAQTANKTQTALPTRYWVNRLAVPIMTLWPVTPEAGTLVYWRMRELEDAGIYSNNVDMPRRFLPAMTAGLAFQLAMKNPAAEARIPMLQAEYERQFGLAAEEDRERASVFLVPEMRGY